MNSGLRRGVRSPQAIAAGEENSGYNPDLRNLHGGSRPQCNTGAKLPLKRQDFGWFTPHTHGEVQHLGDDNRREEARRPLCGEPSGSAAWEYVPALQAAVGRPAVPVRLPRGLL